MVAKGISNDDIPENWVGRWANRSLRMRTMTVSKMLTNQFTSEGSPIFVPNTSVVYFQEQMFCFENDYFLIHGLGKCE